MVLQTSPKKPQPNSAAEILQLMPGMQRLAQDHAHHLSTVTGHSAEQAASCACSCTYLNKAAYWCPIHNPGIQQTMHVNVHVWVQFDSPGWYMLLTASQTAHAMSCHNGIADPCAPQHTATAALQALPQVGLHACPAVHSTPAVRRLS